MFTYTIRTDRDEDGVWHATCWREGWQSVAGCGPVVGRGRSEIRETDAIDTAVEDFQIAFEIATGEGPHRD
jgi:hypothetical protein